MLRDLIYAMNKAWLQALEKYGLTPESLNELPAEEILKRIEDLKTKNQIEGL